MSPQPSVCGDFLNYYRCLQPITWLRC